MILLIAFGKRSYDQYASNLAKSIKHYSKGVKIQLVCDINVYERLVEPDIFDFIDVKDESFFTDPCKVKLSLYELTRFEKTLYLDVDAICLQDINPLLQELKGQSIYVQALGKGKLGDDISYTPWAKPKVWIGHYGIKDTTGTIYGFQSSIVYFEKSSKEYWESINELYDFKLGPSQYSVMWGQSKQHPDELYHTINFFKMKLENIDSQPIIYPDKFYTNEEIFSHYFMSQWGNVNVANYAFSIYDFICSALKIKTPRAEILYSRKYTRYNGTIY